MLIKEPCGFQLKQKLHWSELQTNFLIASHILSIITSTLLEIQG